MSLTVEGLDTKNAKVVNQTLSRWLAPYGLESLTDWAAGLLKSGFSAPRIELELEERQEFKDRFRAVFERRSQIAKGRELPGISVDEILQYEKQVAELESFYGYPAGTLGDPQDRLIQDVSYNELQALVATEEDFLSSDLATQEIFRGFYEVGATKGELVAAAINEEIGAPALQQRIEAANVASDAVVAGFGDLSVQEAESLVARGIDEGQAREAFSLLARSTQLTQRFSREELIDLAAGDGGAVDRFQKNQRNALAQFGGGGGFAGGTAGIG